MLFVSERTREGYSKEEQLAWIVVEHTFRWLRWPDWRLFVRYKHSDEERTGAAGQLGTLLFKNWSITASSARRRVRHGSCSQEAPGIKMRVDTDVSGFIKSTSTLLVIWLLEIVGILSYTSCIAKYSFDKNSDVHFSDITEHIIIVKYFFHKICISL